MTRRLLFLAIAIVAGLLSLGAILYAISAALTRSLSFATYFAVSFLLIVDLFDVIARLIVARRRAGGGPTSIPLAIGKFTPYQMSVHLRPYALVVSVHDAEREIDDFLERMKPYRDRLWVIDDASTDDTWARLRHAGVKCVRGEINRKKPSALRELLRELPPEIETVGVFDPDGSILDSSRSEVSDLERCIFEFQRSGFAAFCPRIEVRQDGWLARLQELEYAFTFAIGRRSLADRNITSGIAFYRRDALEHAFERHKLSVYAEDLRNALLLLGHGERIYYDERLLIETEGKRTVASWFSQRVAWFFGFIKVYHDSVEDVLRSGRDDTFFAYNYYVYMGVLGLLAQPFRVVALALSVAGIANGFDDLLGLNIIPNVSWTDPVYLLLAYAKYTVLTLALLLFSVRGSGRLRLLGGVPLYYLYELVHVIPVTIGYLNWFSLRFAGRRLYRDHFQDEASLVSEFREQFGRGIA